VGPPGSGKTTLACAVGQVQGLAVYIFQCTATTGAEDLLITPVISTQQQITYRASSVVSAMLTGGVVVLDEGNRMPERSWASLVPLLDGRRYVDSVIMGDRIYAMSTFRLCVTLNSGSDTYQLPDYISSRLKPVIELEMPPRAIQEKIVRQNCPRISDALIAEIFQSLQQQPAHIHSLRDIVLVAQCAQRYEQAGIPDSVEQALAHTRSPFHGFGW
jgi:MoxR-like ATPase